GMPNGLTPLRPLVTGDESRGWEGVGRLNIGRNAFCSAAMIAPDRILTAAHCLFNEKTGARVALDTLQFLADWRLGRAVAYRTIRRAVVAKGYRYGTTDTLDRVGHDLALLELARPIQTSSVTPFAVGQSVRAGAAVGVVSYARHRADAPSLQRLCHVLTRLDGALMLDCSVDFGASGAPIFTIRDGVASIVSVVSAKARAAGKKVALGTDVAKLLPAMEAELDAGGGGQFLHAPTPESASARAAGIRIFSPAASAQSAPPAPVAGAAEEQSGALIRAGGAKFLRPEGN
ncbi:trypsin-like serine protease, partial [Thioclava sp. BHET1]